MWGSELGSFLWSLMRMVPWYLPPKCNRERRKEPISPKCPKQVGQAQAKEKCKDQDREPAAHGHSTSTLKLSQGRGERKGYCAAGSESTALQSIPPWFPGSLQSGDIHILPVVKKPRNAPHKTGSVTCLGSGLTCVCRCW